MLDNSPLLHFLEGVVADFDDYKRRVVLMTADVNTGDVVTFSQENLKLSDMPKAAVSSASIPAVFPPFHWGDHYYMDGGSTKDINTASAIDQCLELVDSESDIIIDVFVCGGQKGDPGRLPHPGANTIANYERSRSIWKAKNDANVYSNDVKAHPKVNWRYLAWETMNHAGGISELEFNGDKTWPMQEQGRKDAKTVLKNGHNTHFDMLLEWDKNYDLQS